MAEWGEVQEGSVRSRKHSGGLTQCQIRIMGALEDCHNSKTECSPTNVRARYVERYGELEPPGAWEKDARALTQMSTIFEIQEGGTWALTAWKSQRVSRRPGKTISGVPVIGKSGGSTYRKGDK